MNAALDLFEALFRDLWPGEEEIEVIRPEVTVAGMHTAYSLAAVEDVVDWLKRLDQQPKDYQRAYFSVAPRQDTETTFGEVVAVVCAHVHLHGADPAWFVDQRPRGIPPPSAVIASNTCVEALWFFDRPLRDPADWHDIVMINRRLARAFGSSGADTIEQHLQLPRAYGSVTDRLGPVPVLVKEGFRPDLRYDPLEFFVDREGRPQRTRARSKTLTAPDSPDQGAPQAGSRRTASRRKGKVAKQ